MPAHKNFLLTQYFKLAYIETTNVTKTLTKIYLYTAKTPVLNSTPPVLWEVHTKLVLILTPVGVSLIPLGVKFNTGGCYSNTYQC